ncbi:MAG: hypothetical protein COA78_05540 [Blastopirellula sp.]|nr:MAG: hypothetical protein COA78_05540 [Blastopirellula sp.]
MLATDLISLADLSADLSVSANDGTYSSVESMANSVSNDGRYVVYVSPASNLIANDTNNSSDVFLYDHQNDQTHLISKNSFGEQANKVSYAPSISDDGRFIVFTSSATNLSPFATRGRLNVFLHDFILGTTQLVSKSFDGLTEGNSVSIDSTISADGSLIVFDSYASNLVPGDTENSDDIFLYNVAQDSISRISIELAENENEVYKYNFSISDNNQYLFFQSNSSLLVGNDTNASTDLFRYQISNGNIIRVSLGTGGVEAIGNSVNTSVSADGNSLVFESRAGNLTSKEFVGAGVFYRDIISDTTKLISVNNNGDPSDRGASLPSINADGTLVTFMSSAGNLTENTNNFGLGVFLHDLSNSTTSLISMNSNGDYPNQRSDFATISSDGSTVVFVSNASNLVEGDENGSSDLFAFDRPTSSTSLLSKSYQSNSGPSELPTTGDGDSINAVTSEDGRFIAYSSYASNLLSLDTNGKADVFLYDNLLGTTELISVNNLGEISNGDSLEPSISANGRFIAYRSDATNLNDLPSTGAYNVYVYDALLKTTILASRHYSGTKSARYDCRDIRISKDGTSVVFTTSETILDIDNGFDSDLYIYNIATDTFQMITVGENGLDAGLTYPSDPSISGDGKFVVFSSGTDNILSSDQNGNSDIYLRNLETQETSLISKSASGNQSSYNSFNPVISADSNYLYFLNDGNDLIENPTESEASLYQINLQTNELNRIGNKPNSLGNGTLQRFYSVSDDGRFVAAGNSERYSPSSGQLIPDIIVYDTFTSTKTVVNLNNAQEYANLKSYNPNISGDGTKVVYQSAATNLVTGVDTLSNYDIYVSDIDSISSTVSIDENGNLVIDDFEDEEDQYLFSMENDVLSISLENSRMLLDESVVGTGSETDSIQIDLSNNPSFTGDIILNAGGGDDTLTIDYSTGNFNHEIIFNGGSNTSSDPGDQLILSGSYFLDTVYNFVDESSGSIDLSGNPTITYTGLEPITSNIQAANVTLNYTNTSSTITISDAGSGQTLIDSDMAEQVTFINPTDTLTINVREMGANIVDVNSLANNYPATVNIHGGAVRGTVNLNSMLSFAKDHSLVVEARTILTPNDNTGIFTTGIGSIELTASRNIEFTLGASLSTVDGGIQLIANQAGIDGHFAGVRAIASSFTTTGQGDIVMDGKGGIYDSGYHYGVMLDAGTSVVSTATGENAGEITITGTGGAGVNRNLGVYLLGAQTRVTSVDGDITITGTAADGTGEKNTGIHLNGIQEITSTGSGEHAAKISIIGAGGAGTSDNRGILITADSMNLTSIDGDIYLEGTGGVGSSSGNRGIFINPIGSIQSLGTGELAANITLKGFGGTGTSDNPGVSLNGGPTTLTTIDGDILLEGFGGTGTENSNLGVGINNIGLIQSTGTGPNAGTILLKGTGGKGSRWNQGVNILGSTSSVISVDGDISIIGQGGSGTAEANIGIVMKGTGPIASSGTGPNAAKITLSGIGGSGTYQTHGVYMDGTATKLTSVDGDIDINGTGGIAPGYLVSGVTLFNIDTISSTGTGLNAANIHIEGIGGAGSEENYGVYIYGTTTDVTTVDGDISIKGTGGNGTSNSNHGINFTTNSVVQSTSGSIKLDGTTSSGTSNGINLSGQVLSKGRGSIDLIAQGHGNTSALIAGASSVIGGASAQGPIRLQADTIDFQGGLTLKSTGNLTISPVTAGTSMGVGNSASTLYLHAAEFQLISSSFNTITLGDSQTGTVTIGSPIDFSQTAMNLNIISNDSIVLNRKVNSGGGDVTLIAAEDITLHAELITLGGNFEAIADSDQNGSGLFTLTKSVLGDYVEQQKLLVSDGEADDFFGQEVAISGDTAFVGTYVDGGQGSVYVFDKIGNQWVFQQELLGSDGSRNDVFSLSMALDGDTALIGARGYDDENYTDIGAVYVFTRSNGVWSEQQIITADNPIQYGRFGDTVALDGEYAVIGVPDSGFAGSAYIYKQENGVWVEKQILQSVDGIDGDEFGTSVAISNTTVVIGARFDDHNNIDRAGSAYVFNEQNGVWNQSQKLIALNPEDNVHFGEFLAIDNDTIVLGAHLEHTAYIFTREAGTWSQQQILTASDNAFHFGLSVDIDGETIVVGTGFSTQNGDQNAGSAYIFESENGTWSEQQKILASDSSPSLYFSRAIAIDAGTVIVGAYGNTTNGLKSGAAYLYNQLETVHENAAVYAGSGNIDITASDINLWSNISGTGTLTLKQSKPNTSIGLGGGAGSFNLDDSEIKNLVNGFSSISIGDAAFDASHIQIETVIFNDSVTISGGEIKDGLHTDIIVHQGDTVTLDGIISPGGNLEIGTLEVIGDLIIAPGSSIIFDIRATDYPGIDDGNDQIIATGKVDLSTLSELRFQGGLNLFGGETLTVISRTGGTSIIPVPEGTVYSDILGHPIDATVSYLGGDGDDMVLMLSNPIHTLSTLDGYLLDVRYAGMGAGQILNQFASLNRLRLDSIYLRFPEAYSLADSGRTVTTSIVSQMGLDVQREVSVPNVGDENFARTIDSFTNTTSSPIAVPVAYSSQLAQGSSVIATSDGDLIIEPTDMWIATDDADNAGAPAVIHMLHGPLGITPTSISLVNDELVWEYDIVVPANETIRLGVLNVIDYSQAAIQEDVQALLGPGGFAEHAGDYLTASELASLANYQFYDPAIFDMALVLTPTETMPDGSVAAVPASMVQVHEWQDYYIEVYAKVPANVVQRLTSVEFTLDYDDSMIDLDLINRDAGGGIDNLVISTLPGQIIVSASLDGNSPNIGKGQSILIARIPANSNIVSNVENTFPEESNASLPIMSNAEIELEQFTVPLWGANSADIPTIIQAVRYDINDNNRVDLSDLSILVNSFGHSTTNDPTAYRSDFDQSGSVGLPDLSRLVNHFGYSQEAGNTIHFAITEPLDREAINFLIDANYIIEENFALDLVGQSLLEVVVERDSSFLQAQVDFQSQAFETPPLLEPEPVFNVKEGDANPEPLATVVELDAMWSASYEPLDFNDQLLELATIDDNDTSLLLSRNDQEFLVDDLFSLWGL